MKNEDLLPWALLAGAVIIYNLGGSLFEKLGLKESADGKTIKAQLSATTSPFSPTYWKPLLKGNVVVISDTSASNLAKIIYDAGNPVVFGWGTDEAKIYGALRQCKSRMDVSRIADSFWIRYKQSLVDFLADEFSEAEMIQAINIVNSLPATRTK